MDPHLTSQLLLIASCMHFYPNCVWLCRLGEGPASPERTCMDYELILMWLHGQLGLLPEKLHGPEKKGIFNSTLVPVCPPPLGFFLLPHSLPASLSFFFFSLSFFSLSLSFFVSLFLYPSFFFLLSFLPIFPPY